MIMSDEEQGMDGSHTKMLTAEYRDGQLQIVEMSPYQRNAETHILSDLQDSDGENKYMQVLDPDKGLVQLDLLNLTLVRCSGGEQAYRLLDVGADHAGDATVCVLHSSDGEGLAKQTSKLIADTDNQDAQYVMVEGDAEGSLMFLESTMEESAPDKETKKPPLTPAEILEKAKALQKAKNLISQSQSHKYQGCKRGRKRKGDLPPPHELLASPNFKLFLYSCKVCGFKCNAVKELTAHKAKEHGAGARARGRGAGASLQCARCPHRALSPALLMKHVHEKHLNEDATYTNKVYLDSPEVAAADVLVCGACGFESASRQHFRDHIEAEHGATTS